MIRQGAPVLSTRQYEHLVITVRSPGTPQSAAEQRIAYLDPETGLLVLDVAAYEQWMQP